MFGEIISQELSKWMKVIPVSPPPSAFPSDVLKWMKKNAHPKMALKLMHICKYFQHQEFPYMVFKSLNGCINDYECIMLDDWKKSYGLETLPSNLWITHSITLFFIKDFTQTVLPKIAVCDATHLSLNSQITFKEFKKVMSVANKATSLRLSGRIIKNENGDVIPLEDILESIPNINNFAISGITNSFISHERAATIVPRSLQSFTVTSIDESFDIEECFKFIQNNQHIHFTMFRFIRFNPAFRERIQVLLDNLIEVWSPTNEPPFIRFKNQTKESRDKLNKLAKNFYGQ